MNENHLNVTNGERVESHAVIHTTIRLDSTQNNDAAISQIKKKAKETESQPPRLKKIRSILSFVVAAQTLNITQRIKSEVVKGKKTFN